MASEDSNCSVDDEVQLVLRCLLERVQSMSTLFEGVPIKLEPRHQQQVKKNKTRSTTSKPKKRRIFSSSEDDSSSSSDASSAFDDKDTLINDDSESDSDEQKALRTRQGPRTRNELAVDDLPPIENLTITLSEETPIERIGHIRHIIDGKLVIIESLLHSPALNDDSVLFNRERRSIGLIFETFGPVEKPYYSIRYNDMNSIQQRQLQLNQEVFYAPRETTYTKYVFVQELRALKGSDASWEDDNEPPKFALDYSDDEQEKEARAILRGKRTLEGPTAATNDDGMNADAPSSSSSHPSIFAPSSYSNANRGRGRGRGGRGFRGGGGGGGGGASDNRPPPNLPNWFQSRPSASAHAAPWQSGNSMSTSISNPFTSTGAGHAVTNHHADDRPMRPASHQGNPSTHSAFPWM